MDSANEKNGLSAYIAAWINTNAEDYTWNTYSVFQTALDTALTVVGKADASTDKIASSLQELRIASGSLKPLYKEQPVDDPEL